MEGTRFVTRSGVPMLLFPSAPLRRRRTDFQKGERVITDSRSTVPVGDLSGETTGHIQFTGLDMKTVW